MQVLTITINGEQVDLLSPLPDVITHFEVKKTMPVPLPINPQHTPVIRKWLNDIIDRLDVEYVRYREVLVKSEDLQKV